MYHALAKDTPLAFAGKTFAEWQAGGQDAKSVIGDPGCRNPAGFDFTLAADAPACKSIGFVPFDDEIRKAGLYGDAAWRDVAKLYPPRAPSAVWAEDDFARLNAFDLDFNLMKDGDEPGVFRMTGDKRGGFAVTSEVPGTKGPKCLKCTDRKGMAKAFYPYLQLTPRALKQGNIVFAFSVMQPAQSPASLNLEFRNTGAPQVSGPSIAIGRDGVVQANKQNACKLQPGSWTHFEIRFSLGDKSKGTYELVMRDRSGATTRTLPFGSPAFKDIGWIGLTTPDDADGTFYLDDLKLQIAD